MRTRLLSVLLSTLAIGPGCVTLIAQETLGKATPITSFGEVERAWVQEDPERGRTVTVAVASHSVDHPGGIGCRLVEARSPARLVYRVEPGETALDIERFTPMPTTRFAESPAAREIAVLATDAPDTSRPHVRRPSTLVLADGTYELELQQDEPGAKAKAARIAMVATLPITIAADLALSPVYVLVLGGFLVYDVFD